MEVSYDPGIKLERTTEGKRSSKKRSQFRVRSADLERLYEQFVEVDVHSELESLKGTHNRTG